MDKSSEKKPLKNNGFASTVLKQTLSQSDQNNKASKNTSTHHGNKDTMNCLPKQKKFVAQDKSSSASKPLLDCIEVKSLFSPKQYENRQFYRRRNKRSDRQDDSDDRAYKRENSPKRDENTRSTVDIEVPNQEHLLALQSAFEKVLTEHFLSENIRKQQMNALSDLKKFISDAQSDCQIQLYGSHLFDCCLEKKKVIDIDVTFKETLGYETLKALVNILQKSELYQQTQIDTERNPPCINLIIKESNMNVRITSGYTRGCLLSRLIQIYTQFDPRLIKLIRIFRHFAKVCNIDQPETGTLHPITYHLMIIHFLQQLDPPVLPCLHEYVYGIDSVPTTLKNNHYNEFFRVCQQYSTSWKSTNTISVELLFLQLISYYGKTFNSTQFVVSIQTRMPVLKSEKSWHSKKLLVEDPTDIKRGLCQTMQSIRSIDYFRSVLNAALNYFGRQQKAIDKQISSMNKNSDDNEHFIEIIPVDDRTKTTGTKHPLHNSYRLFYRNLPTNIIRDTNIKQDRIRVLYKHTFDDQQEVLIRGIIQLNSSDETLENFVDQEIQQGFQHNDEQEFETLDDNDDESNENDLESFDIQSNTNDDQDKEPHSEEFFNENRNHDETFENDDENLVEPTTENLVDQSRKDKQDSTKQESQITVETNKIDSAIDSDLSSSLNLIGKANISTILENQNASSTVKIESVQVNLSAQSSTDLYYDFKPENFHAEQGAPYVCPTCNGVGHVKSECPNIILPKIDTLPPPSEEWLKTLSNLCHQVTERCRPAISDTEIRQKILEQLQILFQKDCPDCHLKAFGSFYNGFGFRRSDLDVCFVSKNGLQQNKDDVVRVLKKILQSMRSSKVFENVQPVLHAKVPIIRSKHRQHGIEIDISLHNALAIENTRLLKTYTEIDPRVSQLGYMVKHLAKTCDIGDASRGTISSYAYIIMMIHFLQQIQPPVLPVLQQLTDNITEKGSTFKKCGQWNVYFYDNLNELNKIWQNKNQLSTGDLWIQFLRFYAEKFNYEEHIVCIRQAEPLLRHEKGWFSRKIAIEDPFELTHNLAGGLNLQNWTIIRRVFIKARQMFGVQSKDFNTLNSDIEHIEGQLFDIEVLCPENAPKRCPWCNGPFHIRKHCPKLAQLATGNERRNNYRIQRNVYPKYSEQRSYCNFATETFPAQPSNLMYSRSLGDRQNQRHVMSPQIYSPNHQSNNYQRACFTCNSLDHLQANCPNKRSNKYQRQKSAK